MTDDERMDRARRIREMREGSRDDRDSENEDDAERDGDPDTEDGGEETGGEPTRGESPGSGDENQPAEGTSGGDEGGETDTGSVDEGGGAGDEQETDSETGDGQETDSDQSMTRQTETAGDEAVPADEHETASGTDQGATGGETDGDDGGMHIPAAEIDDVEVDVEEMARQAGLDTAEDGDADDGPDDDGASDTGADASVSTGAGVESGIRESSSGSTMRVLEFALGDENYCLDIEYIEEIVKEETVTRVPNTPEYVEGVVDLRGQITTILDPKVPLDIDDEGGESLIVVFDPEEFEDQGAIGWIVDDVRQVMPLAEEDINKPPIDDEHINGVVDRDGEFVIWTSPDIGLDSAAG